MKDFRKAIKRYEESVFEMLVTRLNDFESEIGSFDKETGLSFLNKIVEMAIKISFYPMLLHNYRINRDEGKLLAVINDFFHECSVGLPGGYDPSRKVCSLWSSNVRIKDKKRREIKLKIDEFVNALSKEMGTRISQFLEQYEYSAEREIDVAKMNDFFQQYLLMEYIYRAAIADGIPQDGLCKYIKDNVFWKGREKEIVVQVKSRLQLD